MKITLLCENEACAMHWLAEWGFSAFIEYEGKSILFDTGFSDVYRHNANLAGIDLEKTDYLALSHFHRDHTRGLLYHGFKNKKKIILHPRILQAVLKTDDENIKQDFVKIHVVLANDFEVISSKEALEFSPGAFFLGEVPRGNDFEPGGFEGDAMEDDTALAFRTDKGAVVVSGCSHAGICNICEYAKEVTGQPLYAVIGGFHLLSEENPPIAETIDYFKTEKPPILLPMHCVDFPALVAFHNAFGSRKLSAGDTIEL
jgi:7,8-dihydropterin-6-yl-methyl-4-(beta-D-ribofuranosyl)aminobenzene 5'-phosphate synthase